MCPGQVYEMENDPRRKESFDTSEFVRERVEIIYNRVRSTSLPNSGGFTLPDSYSMVASDRRVRERRQSTERRKTLRLGTDRRQNSADRRGS